MRARKAMLRHKKLAHPPSLLLLCAVFAIYGSTNAEEERVVNVYNWADYIAADTISNFETEFGLKVNYDEYDSAEVVDAKLLAGSSGYDVVLHSGAMASRLIPEGFFLPLDMNKLPNAKHLDPEIMAFLETYDPGNKHSVPYMWGSTGITYNVDMIRERMPDAPVDSGDLIFKPEIVSKFADCGISLLDSPLDVIPSALAYLGHDVNSINPEILQQAEDLLTAVRPYIRYFSSTKSLIDIPNGEICIAMNWSGDYATAAVRAAEAGIDITLAYTVPKEGTAAWFDILIIPADAPHPDNAHLFLNYLMRPEVIAAITNEYHYGNTNLAASQYVKPEVLADPAIYPPAEQRKRLHASKALPPKAERLRTRVWTRIKTGL